MSSINAGAVLKASLVGLGGVLITTACGYGLNAAAGIPFGTMPRPEEIPPVYYPLSFALSCVAYLLYIVYGALYGAFAQRAGRPAQPGAMALGGAATGLVVLLISLGLSAIVTAFTGRQMLAQLQAQMQSQMGGVALPADLMILSFAIGLVIGLCLVFGVGTGLGAAGGALYGAFARRADKPGPTG